MGGKTKAREGSPSAVRADRAPVSDASPAQGDLADSLQQNELSDPLTGSSAGAPVQAAAADGAPSPSSDHSGSTPASAGGGAPLPDHLRSSMESSFQADFSDVRVHRGAEAAQLGALAYTQGSDIHVRPDQYSPSTAAGKNLIGHELTHVVQQRAGRVSAPQGKGFAINADPGLEREADVAGQRAAMGQRVAVAGAAALRVARGASRAARPVQQRRAPGPSVIQRKPGGVILIPGKEATSDQVVKKKTGIYTLADRKGRFTKQKERLDKKGQLEAGDILAPVGNQSMQVSHADRTFYRHLRRKSTGEVGAVDDTKVEDLSADHPHYRLTHGFVCDHWFITMKDVQQYKPVKHSTHPGEKLGTYPRNTKIRADVGHATKDKDGKLFYGSRDGRTHVLVEAALLAPLSGEQLTGDQGEEALDPHQDYEEQAEQAEEGPQKTALAEKARRKRDYQPGQIRARGNTYQVPEGGGKPTRAGRVRPGDLVQVNFNIVVPIGDQAHVAIRLLQDDGDYSPDTVFVQEYVVTTSTLMDEIDPKEDSPKGKLEDFVEKGGKAFGWVGGISGGLDEIHYGTKKSFSNKVVDGHIESVDSSEKSETLKDLEYHGTGFDAFGGSVGMAQGIFGMAQGIYKFKKAKGLDKVEATLELLAQGSKTASGLTRMVSKGIQHAKGKGESEDGKWGMARMVTSTIAATVGAVKNSVMTIIGLYKLVKNRKKSTKKGEQGAKLGVLLLQAVQSGLSAAQWFFWTLEKLVPLSLAQSIPALGIIINAATAAMSFAKAYIAGKQKGIMTSHESKDYRDLVLEFGPLTLNRMMVDDKRGVFGSRKVYQRFNPLMLARLESHDWSSGDCTIQVAGHSTVVVTQAQYRMIKRYEFASKLGEINQKRQVKGNLSAGKALISMAADIANVTGIGSVVGGAIKAALLAGDLLYTGGKFVQQKNRNRKARSTQKVIEQNIESTKTLSEFRKEGHSTDKSAKTKKKEYRRHARFIFEMVANLPDANALRNADTKSKRLKIKNEYDSAQAFIKSTGVDMGLLYDANGKPESQFKMLVDAISAR